MLALSKHFFVKRIWRQHNLTYTLLDLLPRLCYNNYRQKKGDKTMINVVEIVKYRTSDGIEFEEEGEALEHELQLVLKTIEPNDLVVKNRFGISLAADEIWHNASSAYYVKVASEAALKFFNEASEAEGLEGLPHTGIFRYNETTDRWVTPQDDAQEILGYWRTYDENINFTVT